MRKEEVEAIFAVDGEAPDTGPIEEHLQAVATELHLPRFAVAICTARIEEAAPALRGVLARAAAGEALTEDEQMLLFRGLHILGGARDSEACRPLLQLLRRPTEEVDDVVGDAIADNLPKIAAGVFDGNAEAFFDIIGDGTVDEFVRYALLGAATFLTWDGRIDRDRMRHFLETFYQDRLAPDSDLAWVGWLEAIALLGLRDLAPTVYRAWNDGRIPERVFDRAQFEKDLYDAERAPGDIDRFADADLGYIDDVIELLERAGDGDDAVGQDVEDAAERHAWEDPWTDEDPRPIAPQVNPWRHVGRNDPCPCGSGKKAKKCCLANGQGTA